MYEEIQHITNTECTWPFQVCFYNSCVNNLACLCLIQYLPFNQHYKITFQAECASVLQNKCADGNRVPRPTLVVLSNMHGTCFAPSCHLDVSFRHHVCSQSLQRSIWILRKPDFAHGPNEWSELCWL